MKHTFARISPLAIHDRMVWGWAVAAGGVTTPVQLLADGQPVASEYTGLQLPAAVLRNCGKPPLATAGFCFPLPTALLDGFPHQVQVTLHDADGGIFSPLLDLAESPVRGEARQQGRQLAGTVWFKSKPRTRQFLLVRDGSGKRPGKIALAPLATAEPYGFPAHFSLDLARFRRSTLHLECNGQTLRGSPLVVTDYLIGVVELVTPTAIAGWAFNFFAPLEPMELALRVDGKVAQWFRPNQFRDDVSDELSLPGGANGVLGFKLTPPASLQDGKPHLLEVVVAGTGILLDRGQHRIQWEPVGLTYRPARRPATTRTAKALFPQPAVSLVILNRNGASVLEELLSSFAQHNRTLAAELIVIDHASTDGSLALLKSWQSRLDLRIVPLKRNESFSSSCNLGASLARSPFLLFLNNDIIWLQDLLPSLLKSFDDQETGIVGIKLLKVVGEHPEETRHASEVQHLGVRFMIYQTGYWPHEVDTNFFARDTEHTPTRTPAVTGAAMLCRKKDFDAVGGFDTGYVYGYEDIELCVRLAHRLGKNVVCRNDCVALHHCGHTRLSGRDRSMFKHQADNATLLERHLGLWIKQKWWQSLLADDGYYAGETLCIGLVGNASALAPSLASALPHADIRMLPATLAWKQVNPFHVLVIGDSQYDIRSLQQPRGDLLTVAWIDGDTSPWLKLPWWLEFGAVLAPSARAGALRKSLGTSVQASHPATPLGTLLDHQAPRLRTLIRMSEKSQHALAIKLQQQLRMSGLPCWIQHDDTPTRMIDVCVSLVRPLKRGLASSRVSDGVMQVEWPVNQPAPSAAWLLSELEKHVGSTFRSP